MVYNLSPQGNSFSLTFFLLSNVVPFQYIFFCFHLFIRWLRHNYCFFICLTRLVCVRKNVKTEWKSMFFFVFFISFFFLFQNAFYQRAFAVFHHFIDKRKLNNQWNWAILYLFELKMSVFPKSILGNDKKENSPDSLSIGCVTLTVSDNVNRPWVL